MKAIILSAGQGRRLLPLTRELPKCLLPVQGDRPMLEFQLRALARSGLRRVTVMVGFGAERVERFLDEHRQPELDLRTHFNPLYAVTDNLITTWLASPEMNEDFVLLNGDTLFEPHVLHSLLDRGRGAVNIAIDHKSAYDEDDMKVVVDRGERLRAIGKQLEAPSGEAIGMTLFRGAGVEAFRLALDAAVRDPDALRAWYPPVLNEMARTLPIRAVSIHGHWWTEIDSITDLDAARAAIARRARHAAQRVSALGARPG